MAEFGQLPLGMVIKSGQQTPRRWGWGTPLKKRTATRMRQCYSPATFCQSLHGVFKKNSLKSDVRDIRLLPGRGLSYSGGHDAGNHPAVPAFESQ
jgi:hypothetical protein